MCGVCRAACAQTVYVAGSVFGDLRRPSGSVSTSTTAETDVTPQPKLDINTGGGGLRVGGFLAPRLTLELGVDIGANQAVRLVSPPPSAYSSNVNGVQFIGTLNGQTQSRVTATSVLVGYHPPTAARVHIGVRGGLTFLHTSTSTNSRVTYALLNNVTLPLPVPTPAPIVTQSASVTNEMAATVAGELAIDLQKRLAAVPEIRALGAGGRYIIRPGAALRWSW
jgi:hypothetical protein